MYSCFNNGHITLILTWSLLTSIKNFKKKIYRNQVFELFNLS